MDGATKDTLAHLEAGLAWNQSASSSDDLGGAARTAVLLLDPTRAFAIFAHCFTCTKDIAAASRISRNLAREGIAVLRFDFTGLGNSDGDFSNTGFQSNVADLEAAAAFLAEQYRPPALLIGHSLGGAAVLEAAGHLDSVQGVVSIAAPSDPAHVEHLFRGSLEEIEAQGFAEVDLAGRRFTIRKEFVDDLRSQSVLDTVAAFGKDLLIFHSPVDTVVSIDHAAKIYSAAKHPKSFVSLDRADHLLRRTEDAEFAAGVISAWAARVVASAG